MLRLLVFGKNGQIASSLTRKKTQLIDIQSVGRQTCDIVSLQSVSRAVEQIQPHIVINTAAYTAVDKAESDVEEAFAVNCDGAANIAKITGQAGLPLIHFSTDYVFDGNKETSYVETDETGPTGVYGHSKLAGETAVRDNNSNHVILRTAWVYSAYGNNFLKTMLRLAKDRDEISVVADQFGNPSDSEDMASAAITVAQKLSSKRDVADFGTYHICGPQSMSWAGFAKEIFKASGSLDGASANVREITSAEYPVAATRPANSRLQCTKFRRQFGYENIPFAESVQNTVKAILTSV